MPLPKVCAVIVAAGSSTRMGFDKLTVPLNGKPLLAHTLLAFERCDSVHSIIMVCAEKRITELKEIADDAEITKLEKTIPGGDERCHSVWNGVQATGMTNELVAVHDAARPLVTPMQIQLCVEAAAVHGAASLAERVTDTLQRADEYHRIIEPVGRQGLWRMQTPQIFRREMLFEAYQALMQEKGSVTDETMAISAAGNEVYLVENREWNLKVTVPKDIPLTEFLLNARHSSS